jgi:hypothetical protein
LENDYGEWVRTFSWTYFSWEAYRSSLLVSAATFVYACVRKPAAVPMQRSSSDLTWYVPVLLWGLQATIDIVNSSRCFLGSPFPPLLTLWLYAACSCATGLAILTFSLVAESVARLRGIAVRAGFPALPLSVFPVFMAVLLAWSLILYVATPNVLPGG